MEVKLGIATLQTPILFHREVSTSMVKNLSHPQDPVSDPRSVDNEIKLLPIKLPS